MNANGNGQKGLARTRVEIDAPAPLVELPPWLKSLQESMGNSIAAGDLKEIMAAQIAKAKEGDRAAAQFVFGQAHKMIAAEAKKMPATIIQNNYYGDDQRPDTPAGPGKDLRKMRARADAHLPLRSDRDARPVSDEEEKELHRAQQAAEYE
jgi:hypothetical protein